MNADAARAGRFDQPIHFVWRERSASVSNIDVRVEPLNAREGTFREPVGLDAPIAKRLHGLDVLVVRSMAKVIGSPQVPQKLLDRFPVDIGERLHPDTASHSSNLTHCQPDIFRRVVAEARLERIEMLAQWSSLDHDELLLPRIDHAQPAQSSLRLKLSGKLFREASIGEALHRASDAQVVLVLDGISDVLSLVTLED